ncbi:MAG: hypothetical protein KME13_03740 [Myxacorys californica WJT36-NPBG1]|jgi:hypothetical protein|nr:hypothetical protein [Myxacorys californica WJT36-NPBG1]
MNYLVAVLSDRIKAEEAYSTLEREGLPTDKIAILGKGYKSVDEFGLIDPNEQVLKQVKLMASWLIPFGFIGGASFNAITGLDTFAWAGETGSLAIAGLLGAVSGALGGVLVGGGTGLIIGSSDALPYRNRLNAGKYLVVVSGTESLTRKANKILQQYDIENIQSYSDTSDG